MADGATIYVGGYFVEIGGQPQSYLAALSSYTVDVPVAPAAAAIVLAPPAPSLARTTTRIRFVLPAEDVVSLEVFDLSGRRVLAPLDRAGMTAGPHEIALDVGPLPPGAYWCRLSAGAARLTRKMVVYR